MPSEIVSIYDAANYDEQILRAANLLKGGGVVVLPTETVYGAASALTHPEGMSRLRAIRNGGDGKPFTIHLAHRDDAKIYLADVGEIGQRLMKKLWPGPVGLMFDVPEARRREVVAHLKLAESEIYDNGTITLRCPDHIVASDVLARVPAPVVLTRVDPPREPDERFDLVLEAGPSRYSKPSTLLRVRADGYDIVRAGVYDERIIERLLKTTILFVCSGNTCRSPMSEALARSLLAEKLHVPADDLEKKGINVLSAGSFALPGSRATPQAVDAVEGLGADLTKHRSRALSVELIHQADVIYTMSRNHAAAVTALVPSAAEKTFTLDPAGDIDDPIGGDVKLYRDLAVQLKQLINKRLEEQPIT